MEQNELINKLESLQKTDYDALQSYDKALVPVITQTDRQFSPKMTGYYQPK